MIKKIRRTAPVGMDKDDGSLILEVPVSDLREIKREVLKHGAEAEVLAPEALREEGRAEIEDGKDLLDANTHRHGRGGPPRLLYLKEFGKYTLR